MAQDDGWYPGMIAAQDQYNPDEGAFQYGIRQTPWHQEFTAREGGEPNLDDPNYDYRAAWKAGVRPDTRDPVDGTYHWDSRFKGPDHPNRYVDGVDTITGEKVDPGESWNPEDEYPYGPAVQKGMQQMEDQFGHLANPMPAAPPAAPPGALGSLLNPGYQPSQGLKPPNDTPEVRSYTPTAREALAQRLQGDAPTPAHRGAVKLLTGSGGLGEGVGAIDFLPFGGSVGAQSAAQGGDYQDAAVNLMPGGKAAKKGAKAATEVIGEVANLVNPKLRAKADKLRGTFPQYAHEYPDTGPPELMWKLPDPKDPTKFIKKAGGTVPYKTMEEALAKDAEPGFFLEKKLTPEAERFQKARNTIQKDMDENGYEPYFDPAKRYDVDPKHYGPFADTVETATPKTAETRALWEEKYGTPEIRERLRAGFEEGKKIPESDRWYFMGQLEEEYIKHLGEKEGRAAFKKEFAESMAATTGGAAPYDNYLMAHYANFVNKQGETLPDRGYKLPFPIGGRFASGNLKQAQKYFDEGNMNWPVKNAKRYDFSTAYMGNKNAGTIDEQMMTTFDPTLKNKQPVWYGPATKTLREEAAKQGVDARGFQDIDWAGLKKIKTEGAGKKFEYEGPMINQINRSIETTHRLTGMPREEVVRLGVILKKIPMYAVPGLLGTGAIMGGVADQSKYKPEERM